MHMVFFRFGFVIIILRYDKTNGQQRRKTYVLLGCKMSDKYRKYKKDLDITITNTIKCDCHFKLQDPKFT